MYRSLELIKLYKNLISLDLNKFNSKNIMNSQKKIWSAELRILQFYKLLIVVLRIVLIKYIIMDYINNLFIIKKILVRRIFVTRADFCSRIGGKLSIIRGRSFFKGIAKELSYKMIRVSKVTSDQKCPENRNLTGV